MHAQPGLSRECEELSQHKLLAAKGFFSALPRLLLFPGNRGAQRAPPPLHIGQAEWDAAAQKLFPHESTEGPPLREECNPASWQSTAKQFQDAMCRLKKGHAADSGGWTTELAQGALSNPQVRPEVLKWLHGLAICLHPFFGRQGLTHYHKLVCLDKGGGGVRPILISKLWTKLVSHLLLAQARPDLEPFLKGKQFGIGTPQGGLAMTLSIRARLAANPTHVIASLDFKNAFGTLQRAVPLAEVMSPVPSLAGCCDCPPGQANDHQQPHGGQALQNMGRTPPGDPLSTLLFSTVMSEVVSQAVRTITSEVQVVSYMLTTPFSPARPRKSRRCYSNCLSCLHLRALNYNLPRHRCGRHTPSASATHPFSENCVPR